MVAENLGIVLGKTGLMLTTMLAERMIAGGLSAAVARQRI